MASASATSGGSGKSGRLNTAWTARWTWSLEALPLPVMFVDQEAEWDLVIEYMRRIMSDPRVQPYWYQIPFRLFNATSEQSEWMNCWEPGAEWMREKA